jgi:acetoin utilization deacetylase AcuC-like enzyme
MGAPSQMGSSSTLLFTHPECLDHDTGAGHPECSERLSAVLAALRQPDFAALQWRQAPLAQEGALLRAHSSRHLAALEASIPERGWAALDPDTIISPGSGSAARRAAGALIAAIDAVMAGEGRNGFCAVRPPGHHAGRSTAMGFCLLNNIAIGALHARHHHGLQRIAVIDFDVHHGNGTQEIFEDDAELFFASTHQGGAYPGTGQATERGIANNIVNLPLPAGAGSRQWRQAMQTGLLPALRQFAPDFVLISAGFDAHHADPLAQLALTEVDFRWGTEEICRVAAEFCHGRVVSTLEGGYDLDALALSAAEHVRGLMAEIAVG